MTKKSTIKIRAPAHIVQNLRLKYPDMTDAEIFTATYSTSLMRLELGMEMFDRKLTKRLKL